MSSTPPKHILILGAGITGLSTALALLTSPTKTKFKVTILATHTPGDLSPDYTSPWAGGHWRSHATLSPSESHIRKWDTRTYQAWTKLLKDDTEIENMEEREKTLGLGFRTCRYFWGGEGEETKGGDGSGIWFRDVVKEFGILDLRDEKKAPEGAVMGMRYKSVCFDPPRYLAYLFERVQRLGAKVIKAKVHTEAGLEGLIQDAKKILVENGERGDMFAFINCAGLSARRFVNKHEAEKLYPIRGQTILVKGSSSSTQTYVSIPSFPTSEMLYVVPRPGSGTTILGGCKQVGNWSTEVDEGLNQRIFEAVKREKLCDELRDEKGEFEVLSYQVGFRPGRKGGPRVKVDEGGKAAGTWIVHSYGHAGAGYQGSVGCAERVVELIVGLQDA